jgi:hypothetical protein
LIRRVSQYNTHTGVLTFPYFPTGGGAICYFLPTLNSFTPAREGKGIPTLCGATFASLIAFKPFLSVVDCNPFPGANIAQGTSRYDAIFPFVLSLIHESIWLAGMSCEAEEGAEFPCVDPAYCLTSFGIFFSVFSFVTCSVTPSVACFVILKLSNTNFIDIIRLFDWEVFFARIKHTCILSEPRMPRNIGPSKEAVACVIIPANVDAVSPYLKPRINPITIPLWPVVSPSEKIATCARWPGTDESVGPWYLEVSSVKHIRITQQTQERRPAGDNCSYLLYWYPVVILRVEIRRIFETWGIELSHVAG